MGDKAEEERLVVAQPVQSTPVVATFTKYYPNLENIKDKCPDDIPAEYRNAMSPELWGIVNSSRQWVIRQVSNNLFTSLQN